LTGSLTQPLIGSGSPEAVINLSGGGGVKVIILSPQVMISVLIINDTADPESSIISTSLRASSPVMMDALVLTVATVIIV